MDQQEEYNQLQVFLSMHLAEIAAKMRVWTMWRGYIDIIRDTFMTFISD